MIEKRILKINSKVVKPIDIRKVGKAIYDIYTELLTKHNDNVKNKIISQYTTEPSVGFHINTEDDAEYSTDNLELFQADGILDNKVLTRFTCSVSYFEENLNATLSLADSRLSYRYSDIEVKGRDSNWVNATFQKLQDYVSLWEIQDSKIKKYRWPLSIVLLGMLGYILGTIVYFLTSLFVTDLKPSALYIIPIVGVWFIVGIFSWPLADWFAELWPNIELVPGPEYKRILQRKRHRINWLLSVVIVPFIITLIVTLTVGS